MYIFRHDDKNSTKGSVSTKCGDVVSALKSVWQQQQKVKSQ